MTARPNLLILMADQLSAGALRAYGGRTALTPHIDALADARRGVRILLLQQPAVRALALFLLAGQLPSKIGAYDNAAEFPAQVPTFAHYLRAAGYQTAAVRQDALLRPRPAARIRGAADHRHLPGRLRLDAGLDSLRGASRLVSHAWTR